MRSSKRQESRDQATSMRHSSVLWVSVLSGIEKCFHMYYETSKALVKLRKLVSPKIPPPICISRMSPLPSSKKNVGGARTRNFVATMLFVSKVAGKLKVDLCSSTYRMTVFLSSANATATRRMGT